MDPLSIACGAASLAATATSISVWLCNLIKDVKNVDTKVNDLSHEVTRLTDLLSSMERTVRQCQEVSLTLAHLDDHMWQQIDNALVDCKVTVEELDRVSMRIGGEYSAEGKSIAKLLKKPSTHFRFTLHGDEVADLTKKIYKSNCSMQTALAVVNVSLTFRTQVSQESLFVELRKLKGLVETSLKAARQPQVADSDPFATRQSRNLESLAKAARKFHIDASTTASSQYSTGEDRRSWASWGGSEAGGGLTTAQRERIEQWKHLMRVDEAAEDDLTENTLFVPTDSQTTITVSDMENLSSGSAERKGARAEPEAAGNGKGVDGGDGDGSDEDGDEDGSDVGLDFLKNFEELADASFVAQDYSKAEQFLRMAVERSVVDVPGTTSLKMLKMKLALCCCLQESWEHAAGIIASLPKTRSSANLPVFHLLQAISLAHLAEERFDEAYTICKTVLNGKKKILGATSSEYYECLTVFAAICDKKGDTLEAEAARHSIPRDWSPRSTAAVLAPRQYILKHETLVDSVFSSGGDSGAQLPPQQPSSPATPGSVTASLDAAAWCRTRTPVLADTRDVVQQTDGDESRGGAVAKPTSTGQDFLALKLQQSSPVMPPRTDGCRPANPPSPGAAGSSVYASETLTAAQMRDLRHAGEMAQRHRRLKSTEEVPTHNATAPTTSAAAAPPPSTNTPSKYEPSTEFPTPAVYPPTTTALHRTPSLTSPIPMYPAQAPPPGVPPQAPQPMSPLPAQLAWQPPERPANPGPPEWSSRHDLSTRRSPQVPEQIRSGEDNHRPMPRIRVQEAQLSGYRERLWEHTRIPSDTTGRLSGTTLSSSGSSSNGLGRSLSDSNTERARPHLDLYRSSTTRLNHPPPYPSPIERVQGAQLGPPASHLDGGTGHTPPRQSPVFIEQMDNTGPGGEYISTLEVAVHTPSSLSPASPTTSTSGRAAGHIRKLSASSGVFPHPPQPRVRWIPQKDVSNIGGETPFGAKGPSQFLATQAAAAAAGSLAEHYSVGIVSRTWGVDAFALSKGSDQITLCEVPDAVVEPQTQENDPGSGLGIFGMKKLIRRMKSSAGRVGGDTNPTDALQPAVNPFDPRLWRKGPATPHLLREFGLHSSIVDAMPDQLRRVEAEIANQIRRSHHGVVEPPSSSVAAVRVNAVVCTLPGVLLDAQTWDASSGALADCALLQHAKILPHSLAITQYFLDKGALVPAASQGAVLVVLNCDDTLVECTSHMLQLVSNDHVEVVDSDALYMAELAGAALVHAKFSKLATHQVKLLSSQFRHKMEQSRVDDIIRSCGDQFRQLIFPGFRDDGRSWEVDYDALQQDSTVLHGRLKFGNDEIRACFSPSVRVIKKMLTDTAERVRYLHGTMPSYVLLAGTYANSSFLAANLRHALEDCRLAHEQPASLLQAPEGEDVCALGALCFATSC